MQSFSPAFSPSSRLTGLRALVGARVPVSRYGVLAWGDDRVDGCLAGGGLALGQLHEVAANGIEAETGAVPAAFLAGLLGRIEPRRAVIWIAPIVDLHAPGLFAYGLDPGRIIAVRTDGDDSTAGIMETALRGGGAGAVVGELAQLGRTASRRLQLACLDHGTTGFALRRWPYGKRAEKGEATASVTRWRVGPAPSALAGAEPGYGERGPREPGAPRLQVELVHARGGLGGGWIMEAGGPDVTHPFRVVAELAHTATEPSARRAG